MSVENFDIHSEKDAVLAALQLMNYLPRPYSSEVNRIWMLRYLDAYRNLHEMLKMVTPPQICEKCGK